MSAQPSPTARYITPEEYLEWEERAETRHEYLDGQVTAMAGAAHNHYFLVSAIQGLLFNALQGKPCVAATNDCRVKTPLDDLFSYPDVVVMCSPEFDTRKLETLTNPVVIFEVLSPSTERLDRTEKFRKYIQIPSLRDYVLVSQDAMAVEHRSRSLEVEGHWWVRIMVKPDEELVLDSINCRLKLRDMYQFIGFEELDASGPDVESAN